MLGSEWCGEGRDNVVKFEPIKIGVTGKGNCQGFRAHISQGIRAPKLGGD